jgi:hypothetical protein
VPAPFGVGEQIVSEIALGRIHYDRYHYVKDCTRNH